MIKFPTAPNARQTWIDWGAVDRKIYAASNGYRHTGYDLTASGTDTPIYSVASGIVEHASYELAHKYGRHVLIRHAEIGNTVFYTRYAHLLDIDVFLGQQVNAGDTLGVMGGMLDDPYRGASGGKHLHFEVLLPGKPTDRDYIFIQWANLYSVDPLKWLEDNFVKKGYGTLYPIGARGLNIRSLPSVISAKIGALPYKIKREFIETAKDENGNAWAKLRSVRDEWVCVVYRGEKLAEIELFTDITEPEKEESKLEELERRIKHLENIAGLS